MRYLFACLLLLAAGSAMAQNGKFTISGYLKDGSNGESLLAASVYVVELNKGTTTNEYGFYSLTMAADTYQLKISYVGLGTVDTTLVLDKDIRLNLEMKSGLIEKQEVVITGEKKGNNFESTDMGKQLSVSNRLKLYLRC